jgi:hypothetical protein
MVENMQKLKVEMQGLVEAVRDKEELAKRLQSEFDKMPKEVNRSIYTRRIMDIIKQVRKQKQGIAKVRALEFRTVGCVCVCVNKVAIPSSVSCGSKCCRTILCHSCAWGRFGVFLKAV